MCFVVVAAIAVAFAFDSFRICFDTMFLCDIGVFVVAAGCVPLHVVVFFYVCYAWEQL